MKRTIFLMLTLLMMSAASMNAQVTIGSLDEPHGAAVLDLSKTSQKGLLLPRVSLADAELWGFESVSSTGAEGMMVYNVKDDVLHGNGAGVYVWSGTTDGWLSLKSNFSSAVKVTGFTLDPSAASVDIWAGGSRNFSVSHFQPSTATYQGVTWQITSGNTFAEITDMTSTSCRVRGLAEGTATLKVAGIDDYYSTNVAIHVNPVTVKSFSLNKSTLSLQINGATGTITANNFKGTNDEPLNDVTVDWSIVGDLPTGSSINPTTGNNTTTVTSGTATGTFKVRATVGNIYEECTVTINSCSGHIITNGAYSGPTTSTLNGDGTAMNQLTGTYGFAVTGNLCLAPSDQGSPTQYNWTNAGNQCSSLTIDDASWRLPNIAELGNLQSSRTSYGMAQPYYWSSTERDSTNAWVWYYNGGATRSHTKSTTSYVRCVRSI